MSARVRTHMGASALLFATACAHVPVAPTAVAPGLGSTVLSMSVGGAEEKTVRVEEVHYRAGDLPVLWAVHPSTPEELRRGARKAFSFWNQVLGSAVFFEAGVQEFAERSPEAAAVLIIHYHDGPSCAQAALARMRHVGGRIVQAEIVICRAAGDAESATTAVAHGIGHLLGLNHEHAASLMHATLAGSALAVPSSWSNDR